MISKDGEKTKVVHSERRTIVAEVGAQNASSATSPNPFIPQSTPARKPELNQNTISAIADWLERLEIENGTERSS